MSLSWTTWTMIGGSGLALLGAFILWRTSDWDLKRRGPRQRLDAAAAQRTAENPTELEKRLSEITAEATLGRRARRTAVTVGRHFLAPALGLAGLLLMAVGVALVGIGYWGS